MSLYTDWRKAHYEWLGAKRSAAMMVKTAEWATQQTNRAAADQAVAQAEAAKARAAGLRQAAWDAKTMYDRWLGEQAAVARSRRRQ